MTLPSPNYGIVSGKFRSSENIDDLLLELENNGIDQTGIDLFLTEQNSHISSFQLNDENRTPDCIIFMGSIGGIVGSVIGHLNFTGTLYIPGTSLVMSGHIVGALAGLAAGISIGTIIGLMLGFITYKKGIKRDKTIVQDQTISILALVNNEKIGSIRSLFKQHGAEVIHLKTESLKRREIN